jgi:hypothetical protein
MNGISPEQHKGARIADAVAENNNSNQIKCI